MKQIREDVEKFMNAFGQRMPDECNANLYTNLIHEEYGELRNAVTETEELDAVIDLVWVLVGFALSRGYDLEGAWNEVKGSNMSKLGPQGIPIYREDGKILKGPNYYKPNLSKFTRNDNDNS
jgi:NTP pyrophosphatase (non-canonical NTP hydrolase)